jgi:YEATS domain-containing protein 4
VEYAADEKQRETNKKPVVKEIYDEIVFWEPAEAFYNRVKHTRTKKAPGVPDQLLPVYREQHELSQLLTARNRIARERASMVEFEGQGL